jgi:hypothetical protein
MDVISWGEVLGDRRRNTAEPLPADVNRRCQFRMFLDNLLGVVDVLAVGASRLGTGGVGAFSH